MYRREYTHTRRLLSLVLMLGCLISSLAISHRSANAQDQTPAVAGEDKMRGKVNYLTNLRGAVGTHSLPRERRRAFAQAERRANAFQTPHRSWLQLRFALYSLTIVRPTDGVPGRG